MIAPWIIYAIINAVVTSVGIINLKYLTQFSDNLMITICYGLVLTGVVALLYLFIM